MCWGDGVRCLAATSCLILHSTHCAIFYLRPASEPERSSYPMVCSGHEMVAVKLCPEGGPMATYA